MEQRDHPYHRRLFYTGAAVLAVLLVAALAWLALAGQGSRRLRIGLGVAAGGLFLAFFAWYFAAIHVGLCAACARLMFRRRGDPDRPIVFTCRRCQIRWETGLVIGASRGDHD